jgi:hypothetical protein
MDVAKNNRRTTEKALIIRLMVVLLSMARAGFLRQFDREQTGCQTKKTCRFLRLGEQAMQFWPDLVLFACLSDETT